MRARVAFSSDFEADVARQTEYLVAAGRIEWAEGLMIEIETAAATLAAHPEIGTIEIKKPELRRLVLAAIPLVVRYAWKPRSNLVMVLRLFHARQRRK